MNNLAINMAGRQSEDDSTPSPASAHEFQIALHVAVRLSHVLYGFQGITSDHEDTFLVRVQ